MSSKQYVDEHYSEIIPHFVIAVFGRSFNLCPSLLQETLALFLETRAGEPHSLNMAKINFFVEKCLQNIVWLPIKT